MIGVSAHSANWASHCIDITTEQRVATRADWVGADRVFIRSFGSGSCNLGLGN